MSNLDGLRVAAIAFTRAYDKHGALVQFGAGVGDARGKLAEATRHLVAASDLHSARGQERIVELIRAGHSIESAKRTLARRGDLVPQLLRGTFNKKPKAKAKARKR